MASVSGTITGVSLKGIGNGFQLTVPAATTAKTLKVYCGLWRARGRSEATLSDGSAPGYSAVIDNPSGATSEVITLNFSAASAGQTLTITHVVEENYNEEWGNVTLQAATLYGY